MQVNPSDFRKTEDLVILSRLRYWDGKQHNQSMRALLSQFDRDDPNTTGKWGRGSTMVVPHMVVPALMEWAKKKHQLLDSSAQQSFVHELNLLREILFMLQGFPSFLFVMLEDGTIKKMAPIQLLHLSEQACASMVAEFLHFGSSLVHLRRYAEYNGGVDSRYLPYGCLSDPVFSTLLYDDLQTRTDNYPFPRRPRDPRGAFSWTPSSATFCFHFRASCLVWRSSFKRRSSVQATYTLPCSDYMGRCKRTCS